MARSALVFCLILNLTLFVRAQQFDVVLAKCKDDVGACVSIPLACLVNEDAGACEAVAYVSVKNETIINFLVAANMSSPGYIALGFSDDADIGAEAAVDCINSYVKPAYNNDTNILSDTLEIDGLIDLTNRTNSTNEDIIQCEFDIETGIQVESYSVNYNESYYLVLAYGGLDDKLNPMKTDKVVVSGRFTLNAGAELPLTGVMVLFVAVLASILQ